MKKKLMDPIWIHRRHYHMMVDAELTKEQIGAVFHALLLYQAEGTLPENIAPVPLMFWKIIHADMKREFGEGVR